MALFSRESEYDRKHDDDAKDMEMYGRRKVLDGDDDDDRGEEVVRKSRKAGSLGFKRTERRAEAGAGCEGKAFGAKDSFVGGGWGCWCGC